MIRIKKEKGMFYNEFKNTIDRIISPKNSQFVIDFWEEWREDDHPKTYDNLITEIRSKAYEISNVLDIMNKEHKDYKILEAILTILNNASVHDFDVKKI